MKKKSKKAGKAAGKKKTAKEPSAAQKAHQTTYVILGNLKRAQKQFLIIGGLLVKVRDEKMYADLGYADMESYAVARLHLGQSSLYNYITVYEWVSKNHPEWLKSGAKGVIPDLTDVNDLMWIEAELQKKDLPAERRAGLLELQKKGLDGSLRKGELGRFRHKGEKKDSSLKTYLSKLRTFRTRGARLVTMPPEAIKLIDAAIEIIKNAQAAGGGGPVEPEK